MFYGAPILGDIPCGQLNLGRPQGFFFYGSLTTHITTLKALKSPVVTEAA